LEQTATLSEEEIAAPIATKSLIFILGAAIGTTAANLYYAQPLVALIARSLGIQPESAGLVVTLTQIGYGLGVLFIVPLGDLIENRKLILSMIGVTISALIALTFCTQVIPYFVAALFLGFGTSTVQIIVPLAAHITPEHTRGRVVGSLMSGLMIGIMLSRPIASLLTDLISWHAVFLLSACFMTIIGFTLYKFLPTRRPQNLNLKYSHLIASMGKLFVSTPLLQRRSIYQACVFGAFCLFWTASPLLLMGPDFHFSQSAIAIFALVGVAGAASAPFAGRLADRGLTRIATFMALSACSISFLITHIFAPGSMISLGILVIAAILLDAAVSANLVLGQRAIFSLSPVHRGRLNGLYIATIFIGGAFGSFAGAWAFAHGGWNLTAWVGFAMPLGGLIYFSTEWLTGFKEEYP
jgi:predicted MFS family arabinose efflux permease